VPGLAAGETCRPVGYRVRPWTGRARQLDHYVFGDDADPAAHLPVERRGVLGALTPEMAMQLRETIRRYL
jgi:hypothetical protein